METERDDHFFCSYSRDDSAFALKLASELRNAGVALWIDQIDIPGGQRWDDAIQRALASCSGVIAVISPNAVESQNFMDEMSYALDEGKRVIPVFHRECVVPFRLRRMQRVDFTGAFDKGFTELLIAIRSGQLQRYHRRFMSPPVNPTRKRVLERITAGMWHVASPQSQARLLVQLFLSRIDDLGQQQQGLRASSAPWAAYTSMWFGWIRWRRLRWHSRHLWYCFSSCGWPMCAQSATDCLHADFCSCCRHCRLRIGTVHVQWRHRLGRSLSRRLLVHGLRFAIPLRRASGRMSSGSPFSVAFRVLNQHRNDRNGSLQCGSDLCTKIIVDVV